MSMINNFLRLGLLIVVMGALQKGSLAAGMYQARERSGSHKMSKNEIELMNEENFSRYLQSEYDQLKTKWENWEPERKKSAAQRLVRITKPRVESRDRQDTGEDTPKMKIWRSFYAEIMTEAALPMESKRGYKENGVD